MAKRIHRTVPATENHVIQGWEVANEAARLALVPVASDKGRVAMQTDDGSLWALVSSSPTTWERLGHSGDGSADVVLSTGTLTPRALSVRHAERMTVDDFGAIGDGASHPLSQRYVSLGAAQAVYPHATSLANEIDWAATQAAINAAWSGVGNSEVHFNAKRYVFNKTLVIPATLGKGIAFVGCGRNYASADTAYSVNGTRLKYTATDGTDFITAISSIFNKSTYFFENLVVLGPDTDSPRTTTSGNGIRVSGADTAQVFMRQVNVQNFFGVGKAGIWMDNVEDSSYLDCRVDYCHYGWRLSNAFNANVLVNCGAQTCKSAGFYLESGGLHMVGGLVQTNYGNGILCKGGMRLTSVHFENNNSDAIADQCAVHVVGDSVISHLVFDGCNFGTARDYVLLTSNGAGFIADVNFRNCVGQYPVPGMCVIDSAGAGYVNGVTIENCAASGYVSAGTNKVNGVRVINSPSGVVAWGEGCTLQVGGGAASDTKTEPVADISAILTGTAAWNVTVNAGATQGLNIGVVGAANGDVVAFGAILDGNLQITAAVNGANNVLVNAYNPTGAPIVINNRTFRVLVFKAITHVYP